MHKVRLWILCIIWLVCFVSIWQLGIIGNWILRRGAPLLLPAEFDSGFAITKIVSENLPVIPERGLRVSITPQRLKSILADISPLFKIIPPGIIEDGLVVHGTWVPEKATGYSVPITINCSSAAGDSPQIIFRYPFDELNGLLKIELAEDWREEDEYFLGTYTRTQRIWFNELSIKSEAPLEVTEKSPILLRIRAEGRLRYKMEDGIIDATITAQVKELAGIITLEPEPHKAGIGFKYRCSVDNIRLSVKKMAPWLERRLAADLQKSTERSMNKRRRRKLFAKMRVPYWFPLDTKLDIGLTESQTAKEK